MISFPSKKILSNDICQSDKKYFKGSRNVLRKFTNKVDLYEYENDLSLPFNRPPYTSHEDEYVFTALRSSKLSGDGFFSKNCQQWFEQYLGCYRTLLTPSCTHALEMAAMLIGIREGDEIIMPSYTFVSTANAFVLRGAKIKFVDIRQDTMNLDEKKIEAAITEKTIAIVPVHYAGVACEMDTIMEIASQYGLFVIEDAAQAMTSTYKGKALGSIGHLGTFSFHETKNFTSGGEGGLLIVNAEEFVERSEIIREKGTNRSSFLKGEVNKYTWVDKGSSYLLNDLSAAYLWGQLQMIEEIQTARSVIWKTYNDALKDLGEIQTPVIPVECRHNSHMYYIKVKNIVVRDELINYLGKKGIPALFHYVPLHTSPAGKLFGTFSGDDIYTTKESECLLRLPMFYGLEIYQVLRITDLIKQFYIDRPSQSSTNNLAVDLSLDLG